MCTIYKPKVAFMEWKVWQYLLLSEPEFKHRYERRGALVYEKATGELRFILVSNRVYK